VSKIVELPVALIGDGEYELVNGLLRLLNWKALGKELGENYSPWLVNLFSLGLVIGRNWRVIKSFSSKILGVAIWDALRKGP